MSSTFFNIPKSKQQRILDTAFKHFAEHGYENTSTNAIIKDLGISKGSLFSYFSSKLELYNYLVELASVKLLTHVENKEITGSSWKERLLSYTAIEFDFLISEPIIYRFFYKVVGELNHPQLADIKTKLFQQANCYLNVIYEKINLPNSPNNVLKNHVAFILNGYNEYFTNQLSFTAVSAKDKQNYVLGLKQHLNLIKEHNNE